MTTDIPFRFFISTFAWSWLFWLPLTTLSGLAISEILVYPAMFLGAFGPAFGACYSVWSLQGRGALLEFLKPFAALNIGWTLLVKIFLILGTVNAVAWFVPEMFGHERLGMLLPSIWVFPAVWLFMILLGGGQEEIGWRGYILPFLESRFGLWKGNILLGIVWSLWHLPLWFVPQANQGHMPFAAFVIGLIGLSFIFSWVMKAAHGKPFAALIAHGTSNALIALFPTFEQVAAGFQLRFWLHEALLLAMGVAVILWMKKQRMDTNINHPRLGSSSDLT